MGWRKLLRYANYYINLDTVLMDFNTQFQRTFEKEIVKLGYNLLDVRSENFEENGKLYGHKAKLIKKVDIDFYIGMRWTTYGKALWKAVRRKNYFIYTRTDPKDYHIVLGKSIWVEKNLKIDPKILIYDVDGMMQNRNHFDYLIDDSLKACIKWAKAGGNYYLWMDKPIMANGIIEDIKRD